jgi:hypothetical protein
MNSRLRAEPRQPAHFPMPKAATVPLAAAMFPRPWCRRSIGCKQGSIGICTSAIFKAEFTHELKTWVGRPTALSHAPP